MLHDINSPLSSNSEKIYISTQNEGGIEVADLNEGNGVEGDTGIKSVSEIDGQWVIEANFNYSAQLSSGEVITSFFKNIY